jgi:hypothetical protein
MAAKTVSIASDSTHLDIRNIMTTMLARHGEGPLLASLAQAIGFQRIIQAAGQGAPPTFRCDDPSAADAPRSTCVNAPIEAPQDDNVITYYDAGCPGAKKLARGLKRSIFKKGFTCQPCEAMRLGGLANVTYGGWAANQTVLDAKKPMDGWQEWEFARHEAADTDHLTLPEGIVIEGGLWRVYLPAGIDPRDFDRIVTAAMMPRQLAYWVMYGEGKVHCQQQGLDPQEFVRLARDEHTGVLRPVEELYVYSPRRDGHWFAAILADALARVRAGVISH